MGRIGKGPLDLSSPSNPPSREARQDLLSSRGPPESSLLVSKIVSGLMPPGRKLAEAQILEIRSWIDEQKPVLAGVTEADVTPILQMRCVVCHGKRTQEAGLDLRTQEAPLKGGKSGPALVPGRPEDRLILIKVAPALCLHRSCWLKLLCGRQALRR